MTKAEMLECRSCLNTSENFYNLFDKYKCEYDFPKIINKLTGIQVNKIRINIAIASINFLLIFFILFYVHQINEKDNLTKLICVDCFDQLVQIGKFQKRFVESNEKLHNKLNSLDESIKADKLEQIYHFDTIQHDVIIENEVSESIVLLQIESTNFNELIANHVVEEEYITNIEQQIVNAPPADEKCDNSANKSKNVKKSPTKQRSKTNDVQFEIVTSDKDALICKTCGKEFVSVRSRRVHEYVHKQGQFLCKHCPRILTTAGFLRVHMQNTHNVFVPKTVSTGHAEPLALTDCQCDICKKYFAADRIARHMKTHSRKSERPKCPICPQTFSCAKNIQRHLKKQHADDNSDKIPQFTCDTCSESFYRAVELYEHSKEHDSNCNETDTGYNLVCDVCEIKCETYEAYARHMIDNHNQTRIQPYKCRICSVRNGSKTGLYMHINCHYSNLLTSIATHTTLKIEPSPKNEKPFPCTYCDHRFRNARRLEEHTRVHTGNSIENVILFLFFSFFKL